MGIESQGGPRGRHLSKKVRFGFTPEHFFNDLFLFKKAD